jgi:DNA repair protein SbcC/Rad50
VNSRLKALSARDFRSIRGEVSVSLDAPVVLMHGPNGAGKTSLLSAIELALTGAVPSLRRAEPDYIAYLPHKSADEGHVALEMSDENGAMRRAELLVTREAVRNAPLLDEDAARFFSERCYLAQSTLGRLLEIYQLQDTRRSDSPLTRFVKDLLGLDRMEAVIDGLHSAGDVRRLRDPVPSYWAAREDIPKLQAELNTAAAERDRLVAEESEIAARLRQRLEQLDAELVLLLDRPAELASRLAISPEEASLVAHARLRRDLAAALQQWRTIAAGPDADARSRVETVEAEARAAFEVWQSDTGAVLGQILQELLGLFTDLPAAAAIGLERARLAARERVAAELRRCSDALSRDEADAKRLADLDQNLEQGRARVAVLDRQIAGHATEAEDLARALAHLAPHIHAEDCPLCGRDFSEVSRIPLRAHVSERVGALTEQAGRLQALSQDRAVTVGAIAQAERGREEVLSRRLPEPERDALKVQRARLSELEQRLDNLQQAAQSGDQLSAAARTAARRLADLRSKDQTAAALRDSIGSFAAQIGEPTPEISEPLDQVLGRLQNLVEARESALGERQSLRRHAADDLRAIDGVRRRQQACAQDINRKRHHLERLEEAKAEADRRIELAKELARRMREARTNIVRRVFNDELNAVWRDLFVRLAPEEPFIPAFALPASPGAPVEAVLETHYRQGGKGGNPRAMLSAGNLNTAALTLFLALHLSVKPKLPWLVVDDPVQSMDEVHIAQFAALLRTLAKRKNRQIIIATHDRPLFDYLALELSPAYLDDRLITVELGHAANGQSTAVWEPRIYEPDRAIAA